MVLIKKPVPALQAQENEIHKALKIWYRTPGIQRELRNKENEAVQAVLEVLERRRARIARLENPDPQQRR